MKLILKSCMLSAFALSLYGCNTGAASVITESLIRNVAGQPAAVMGGGSSTASVGDDLLRKRAAFALDTTPDRVSISQRSDDSLRIDFVATVGKRSHQCYVTAVSNSVSDAICSGPNSVKANAKSSSNAQCNALLKQANRC